MSWFLRGPWVLWCAPRPSHIALPSGGEPPDSRPDLPPVLPHHERPVNPPPRSPVGRWSSATPVKFLAADRVPEKCSRGKEER